MFTRFEFDRLIHPVDPIFAAIQNNEATALELCYFDLGNRLTKEEKEAFCAALRVNTSLKYLELTNNNIDDNFALMIVESLKHNKYILLDLSNNNISLVGAEAITTVFENNVAIHQKLTITI
jgi:Ran GTPase-activating protein (RanGAP) involved in mRNA processing and transport